MLQNTFLQLINKYTADQQQAAELWSEIAGSYSAPTRHYHTLQHLEHLLLQLTAVNGELQSWDTILFTLFYHDVIYDAERSDNEAKSAALATTRMQQIGVPEDITTLCAAQILATKAHSHSADSDTNYFTDADLSILGQDWKTYGLYCDNVRTEYSMYPDAVYKPGRRKVLKNFLSMDSIFKTSFFKNKLELQARHNLQKELSLLS